MLENREVIDQMMGLEKEHYIVSLQLDALPLRHLL